MTWAKAALRRQGRAIRAAMSEQAARSASLAICERIRALPDYVKAKTVAIYHPLSNEVDLRALREDEKIIVYPRLLDRTAKTMEFAPVADSFVPGVFDLMEPDGTAVGKDEIDLILVPGLVFDEAGGRIGYGAGYYDLYLKDFRGVVVGVAYERQIVRTIPADPWDVPMRTIVTEQRVLSVR